MNKFKSRWVIGIIVASIILAITLFILRILTLPVSIATEKIEPKIEASLDKYINYNLSEQDKGTLVQYSIRTGIEYEENQNYVPIKQNEINIDLNRIDNHYPFDVKVIAKSTQAINGNLVNDTVQHEYDKSAGKLTIITSNQNENNETIYTKGNMDERDEFTIICYYDTYTTDQPERELQFNISTKYDLYSEDNTKISKSGEFKQTVKEDNGELISTEYETENIYNGYIKSNILNGTQYTTNYKETEQITISKRKVQENILLRENNQFVEITNNNGEEIKQELGNNGDLVLKETKVFKRDIINLLGENGTVQILDAKGIILGEINKDTKYSEDGTFVMTYNAELDGITIKTSQIINEGILRLEHIKEIKPTMKKTNNIYIKNNENIVQIKDAQTSVDVALNSEEWTNEKQNEIIFDVKLNSNGAQYNLFKNPTISIELPNEVEKIILGESSLLYGNGLELQNVELYTKENGNKVIKANLVGSQTEYNINELGIGTSLKIPATIILEKDIETCTKNINIACTNEYVIGNEIESNTINKNINIISHIEKEKVENTLDTLFSPKIEATLGNTVQVNDNLKLEVIPTKGATTISNEDIVYEGEYIKFNIKVTNTTSKDIENVKIKATIPEGTTYGELEAEYYKAIGKYEYNFDQLIREKVIDLGTIYAGQSTDTYYEIKVNDLAENEEDKQISTSIKAFNENLESRTYNLINNVKPAEIQIFMGATLDHEIDGWNYLLKMLSNEEKNVNVTFSLPEYFETIYIYDVKKGEDAYELTENHDNIITLELLTNRDYYLRGIFNSEEISKNINYVENNALLMTATATVNINDKVYNSNETRILYSYDNISVTITSENEGEDVKYNDEINYEIKVSNIRKTNLDDPSYFSQIVHIMDFLPDNVIPVSITYNTWEEETNEISEDRVMSTGNFHEGETITEDIGNTLINENDEELADIDIDVMVPYQKSVTISVKTRAGFVTESTKVENKVTVTGSRISTRTSNYVTHNILPYNYDEPYIPDEPESPEIPDEPIIEPTDEPIDEPIDVPTDNPADNPADEPINRPIDQTTNQYNISGIAWIDENRDGQRQDDEKTLSGIRVLLVDMQNTDQIKSTVETNNNGWYNFANIDAGNYLVVFRYDTDKYKITEYKKHNVSNKLNSDAIEQKITLNGNEELVGVTDIIEVKQSVDSIDIGLVGKNNNENLKIEKYISKVKTETNKRTNEKTYNNVKLVKTEIKAKEIEGAKVTIEYKIIVTNNSNSPITLGKLVDNIPDGFEFSEVKNRNWILSSKNIIVNESIENKKLESGDSKQFTIILTKVMTGNTTGTYTNKAEIGNISSSADIIISISTGRTIFIIILFALLLILAITGYLIHKYGIIKVGKTSMFLIVTTICIFEIGIKEVQAADAYYIWDGHSTHNAGTDTFTERGTGARAVCQNYGKICHGVCYAPDDNIYDVDYEGYYLDSIENVEEKRYQSGPKPTISLTKRSSTIKNVVSGSYCKIGPLSVSCSDSGATYSATAYSGSGGRISCSLSGNTNGFYVSIPMSSCSNGVSRIVLKATGRTQTYTVSVEKWGKPKYYPDNGHRSTCQTIKDRSKKLVDRYKDTEKITPTASVEWTGFPGIIQVVKKDYDSGRGLSSVKIRVNGTTKTTDSSGKVTYENLSVGSYTIEETSLPPIFGYTEKAASVTKYLSSGMVYTCNMSNVKQTGNLIIYKRDYDVTSEKLNDPIQFRIKKDGSYVTFNNSSSLSGTFMVTAETTGGSGTVLNTSGGQVKIVNLLKGNYSIEEISVGNNNFGYFTNYLSSSSSGTPGNNRVNVNVTRQKSTETERTSTTATTNAYVYNQKRTGNLRINKKDKDNTSRNLSGIQFKIKQGNEYIRFNNVETITGTAMVTSQSFTTSANSTTLITDNNGQINLVNMLIGKDGAQANYQLEEISVGNNDKYDIDGEYIFNENTKVGNSSGTPNAISVSVERQKSNLTSNTSTSSFTTKNIYNRRKYVNISGNVWEDVLNEGKINTNDNIFNSSNDIKLQILKVTLRNSDGSLATSNGKQFSATVETNSSGAYLIENAIIDSLSGEYLEFEYDGEIYTTVTPYSESGTSAEANTSKAKEVSSLRTTLDNKYQNVTGTTDIDISKVNKTNGSFDAQYNLTQRDSTEDATAITKYRTEFNNAKAGTLRNVNGFNTSNGYISENQIIATTKETGYGVLGGDTVDSIRKNSQDVLPDRNCGLVLREQVDLSVSSDIDNVEIKVNGYKNNYMYKRNGNTNSAQVDDQFRVDVKANKYDYERKLYRSDIAFMEENSNLCEVFIVYKMTVANNSQSLSTKVTDLLGYYDSRYYEIDGIYVPTADRINNPDTKNITELDQQTKNIYKGSPVNGTNYSVTHYTELKDTIIPAGASRSFYVKYKVNPQAVIGIAKENKSLPLDIPTAIEINTYTTYYDNQGTQVYASIDADSAPDNTIISNKNTYEDDTAYAPSITIKLSEGERTISGTVFKDEQTTESENNNERLGDGIYNNNDGVIEGVKVDLLKYNETNIVINPETNNTEVNLETATLYNYVKNNETSYQKVTNSANTTTTSNGTYKFEGIIPDKYILRFTYANGNVVYKNEAITNNSIDVNEYKATIIKSDIIKDALNNNNIVGKITDNPNQKLGTTDFGSQKWHILNELDNDITKTYLEENEKDKVIRYSDAMDTNETVNADLNSYYINQGAYKDGGITFVNEKEAFTGVMNIQVEYDTIEKDNNLADTTTTTIQVNGKDSNGKDVYYTVEYLRTSTDNVDFGIVEKAKHKYDFKKDITNLRVMTSATQIEVDGDPRSRNLDFTQYLPGIKPRRDLVKMELENELMHGRTLEITYEVTATNNSETNYLTSEYYKYGENKTNIETTKVTKVADYLDNDLSYILDDSQNRIYNGKLIEESSKNVIMQLNKPNTTEKELLQAETYFSDDVIVRNKKYNLILILNSDKILQPGESEKWQYKANKLMSNDNEELSFQNDVEALEYFSGRTKPYGSMPGNYNTETEQISESDNFTSEMTVTSPTGEDRSYTLYIIVGTVLVVIAGGVILIKRKVL